MSVTERATPDQLMALMKSRRVCRSFTPEPVSDDDLRMITQAARWASSASNRRLHKFLIVRDPEVIKRVRTVSPGMLTQPPAMIVILTDLDQVEREQIKFGADDADAMDVGTAAMNMQNMAHALGLGSCPVTSFSDSGVKVMLELPDRFLPEWILIVGHPAPAPRGLRANAPKPVSTRDLTYWERAGEHDPPASTS